MSDSKSLPIGYSYNFAAMYYWLCTGATICSCLLSYCEAQESQSCAAPASDDVLSRLEALEAALPQALGGQRPCMAAVPGVKVFPKGMPG